MPRHNALDYLVTASMKKKNKDWLDWDLAGWAAAAAAATAVAERAGLSGRWNKLPNAGYRQLLEGAGIGVILFFSLALALRNNKVNCVCQARIFQPNIMFEVYTWVTVQRLVTRLSGLFGYPH